LILGFLIFWFPTETTDSPLLILRRRISGFLRKPEESAKEIIDSFGFLRKPRINEGNHKNQRRKPEESAKDFRKPENQWFSDFLVSYVDSPKENQ
jgi:hypothetical protein